MNAYIKSLTRTGFVSSDDVLRMRRRVFGDQVIDRAEMADLLQLAQCAPEGDPGWKQFLAEALADYFVRQAEPRGYMSEDAGDFLVDALGDPGEVNLTLLDALVHMVRHAAHIPAGVIAFGLEAIRARVLDDLVIDAAEAERIRAFLFAAGSDGNVAVTRAEADFLFDLNDASHEADNDPVDQAVWADLFMKAIANHLMAHIGYQPPTRREALRREAWLADRSVEPAGFLQRMTGGGFGAIFDAYRKAPSAAAAVNERRATEAAVAEQLTESEGEWLARRLAADGRYNQAERALISHLALLRGDADLPAPVRSFLDRYDREA